MGLDWTAIRAGGSVCLVFAVPFTFIAAWLTRDDRESGWAGLMLLASIGGFVLGSGVAAWRQRRSMPLAHGAVTALIAYGSAQLVFMVFRLLRGRDVNVLNLLFSLTVVTAVGLIGGSLGAVLHRRGFRPPSAR
jgi:uncharacterized membrane protein YeaQ/YmgE (transglycosylase-associated protein family)